MFSALALPALLATGALAHYRLDYPPARGPFDSDGELEFCGSYTDVTTNRTEFPLSGGNFQIRQSHENWTVSVLISTVPNPRSFDDFNAGSEQQFARYWANEPKSGNFCIPLDLSSTGIEGVEDGANVTIQIVVSGGDGDLYQCADLTLSANATTPGTCTNSTKPLGSAHGSASASTPATSGEPQDQDGSSLKGAVVSAIALGFVGVLAAATAF